MSFEICSAAMLLSVACAVQAGLSGDDTAVRRQYLKQLRSVLPPEKPGRGRVSPLDATWAGWLKRTGELPPNFDKMPSIPFLPDPLILDEGGQNIPVKTAEQWRQKREWIAQQVKHFQTGSFPPAPDNLVAKILSETKTGAVTVRTVELRFGPDHRAKMTARLFIPPAKTGPLPVFMTQWSHRLWALLAVRRGYIGCIYAGSDDKDDSEQYADIWYPKYDFSRLLRRAWGAMRVVDYLCTLGEVDKKKIAITGHSRNGKQSLLAAAFDDRIAAVISSSGGTGAEDPWRYTSEPFDNETIAQITTNFPNWFHPRLRFFVGREHKLPIDQNLLMSLIAPRGLMLSSAATEHQGNPWGIEQCYRSLQKVYNFLNADDKIAIRFRWGRHGTSARDIEDYIDFFDYCFGRSKRKPENKLFYDYSFEKWRRLSGEKIDPADYPEKSPDELLLNPAGDKIKTAAEWQQKKAEIRKQIRWLLGDEPPGAANPGPKHSAHIAHTDSAYSGDYLARTIGRPGAGGSIRRLVIGGYNGFGDYLEGNLYYPAKVAGKTTKPGAKLPVVIWLHEYSYSTGFAVNSDDIIAAFVNKGFAVFLFDQLGFGTRIAEGTNFYQRYPHWSKLGKMVADTKAAVDTLGNLDIIDANRISAAGYSLGGTVAIFAAAVDDRIAAVASVCGVTPFRTTNQGNCGIRWYYDLHGLLPRLGFFTGRESRIGCDFQDILACIAPRPALVVAPQQDRFANIDDVRNCVSSAGKIYNLLNAKDNLHLYSPDDYNRFSRQILKKVLDWMAKKIK